MATKDRSAGVSPIGHHYIRFPVLAIAESDPERILGFELA